MISYYHIPGSNKPSNLPYIVAAIIIIITIAIALSSCKSQNKANYGNKAGQGKYWKQGAQVNHHRL